MNRFLILILFFMHADHQEFSVVEIKTPEVIPYRGKPLEVILKVEVKKGYHIQSNLPDDESLIPTTVDWKNNDLWEPQKIDFPLAREFFLKGEKDPLKVFEDKFEIRVKLSPSEKPKTGRHSIEGQLRYQACDSTRCFFPREINFSILVDVDELKPTVF